MKQDIPPFYLGQRVVAIVDHSQGYFKKGDQFTVGTVTKSCCNWVISIGVKTTAFRVKCSTCSAFYPLPNNEGVFVASAFRAITSDFQTISYSKVLEEVLVGAN